MSHRLFPIIVRASAPSRTGATRRYSPRCSRLLAPECSVVTFLPKTALIFLVAKGLSWLREPSAILTSFPLQAVQFRPICSTFGIRLIVRAAIDDALSLGAIAIRYVTLFMHANAHGKPGVLSGHREFADYRGAVAAKGARLAEGKTRETVIEHRQR